ncbi:MAG TPA: hypothetical protein VN814_25350 [Caulobacteraceae bacterium]|nr:hypothetical protein [Caulobacteraceae bacterium]
MRPALFLAAALALGALPAAASPTRPPATVAGSGEATTTTDLRCLFVSGALAQSDDPDLKNIGTLSLFYFWGRLEGRLPAAEIAPRLIEEAKKMSPDDIKAEAQVCANMSRAASQNLSDISDALQKSLGPPPPAAPAPPETAPATPPAAMPETTPTAPPGR